MGPTIPIGPSHDKFPLREENYENMFPRELKNLLIQLWKKNGNQTGKINSWLVNSVDPPLAFNLQNLLIPKMPGITLLVPMPSQTLPKGIN